jgi:small subunit ribosomal protein S9
MTEIAETTYTKGLGRRKQAVAQVRLYHNGSGKIIVNERDLAVHLPVGTMQQSVKSPLVLTGTENMFDIKVLVKGGGNSGQADAIRHGISRALVEFNPEFRTVLKKEGMMTRDARVRERKKFGKKSARRAPQFSKR